MGYYLIDSPVTAYSKPAEIEGWIAYLRTLPQDDPQVSEAMAEASRLLEQGRGFWREIGADAP